MQGWGLGFYWRQMWSPSSNPDSAGKQDTNWPCILFPVMGVFGPLIFPYIAQERTTKNCTLFWTERSLWAISELFFFIVHSSLYNLFLSLRKSRINHRFWALAQFIRAMCPALGTSISNSIPHTNIDPLSYCTNFQDLPNLDLAGTGPCQVGDTIKILTSKSSTDLDALV